MDRPGPGLPECKRRRRRPRAAGFGAAARRAHLDAGLRTRQPARREGRVCGLRRAADPRRHAAVAAAGAGRGHAWHGLRPGCCGNTRSATRAQPAVARPAFGAAGTEPALGLRQRPAAGRRNRRRGARRRTADHGAQRQPGLHAPAAAGGTLPHQRADRHRGRRQPPGGRRHAGRAGRRPVPRRRGHAPDLLQHLAQPGQPLATTTAPGGGGGGAGRRGRAHGNAAA